MNDKIISPSIPPNNKNIFIGCVVVVVVLCVCFIAAYAFFNNGTSAPDYKSQADIMCQVHVTNSLKAPSTAKFEYLPDASVEDLGNNTFGMNSYVDAQNSFGAMLRTNYYCKIQYIGADGSETNLNNPNNWNILQLTFSQ